ncbi:unannotated protein [freshwater metagenome]|uniref:Unannotated protein n=1 Tax=freshwater metagenome TaxID=449393 RepID=A0A6J6QQ04_9ZZZZ
MAGLVHDLSRGVVLGINPRNSLNNLGRADQRALLAVHELTQAPVLGFNGKFDPLFVTPASKRGSTQVDSQFRNERCVHRHRRLPSDSLLVYFN